MSSSTADLWEKFLNLTNGPYMHIVKHIITKLTNPLIRPLAKLSSSAQMFTQHPGTHALVSFNMIVTAKMYCSSGR